MAVGVVAFLVGAILFRNLAQGLIGFAIIFGSTAEFWLGTSVVSIDEKQATLVRTGFSLSAESSGWMLSVLFGITGELGSRRLKRRERWTLSGACISGTVRTIEKVLRGRF